MAFERDGTDELCERAIKPVLRRNKVTPVIINRRQSNDDLNNQIVESLKSCDVCIADLTYARPSVYFEAGFAQRAVPVIYSVRADHLGRGQPDDARVHFDLQMKPLLRWRTPGDQKFQKALETRLRQTFLASWNRAQRNIASRETARRAFGQLSVLQRLAVIRRRAMLALRPYGLRAWAIHLGRDEPTGKLERLVNSAQLLVSEVEKGKERRVAVVLALETITAAKLRELRNDLVWLGAFHGPSAHRDGNTSVAVEILCLALSTIPTKRVEVVFSTYGRGDREGRFVHSMNIGTSTDRPISVTTTLDCIGDIRSEDELREELRSLLSSTFAPTA